MTYRSRSTPGSRRPRRHSNQASDEWDDDPGGFGVHGRGSAKSVLAGGGVRPPLYTRSVTDALEPSPPEPLPVAASPQTTTPPSQRGSGLAATPPLVIDERPTGPSLIVRAVWFVLVGWWLSGVATAIAYFLCATIIGLPLGFMLFNQLPLILTLRPRSHRQVMAVRDGVTYISGAGVEQLPLLVRAVWFVLVGWWLGAIYVSVAWFLCVIIVTLPIGLWLYNRIGAVMTLLRY